MNCQDSSPQVLVMTDLFLVILRALASFKEFSFKKIEAIALDLKFPLVSSDAIYLIYLPHYSISFG